MSDAEIQVTAAAPAFWLAPSTIVELDRPDRTVLDATLYKQDSLLPTIEGHRVPLFREVSIETQELIDALQPFAAVGTDRNLSGHPDGYSPRPSRGRPHMADYRRAAALLRKLSGQNS